MRITVDDRDTNIIVVLVLARVNNIRFTVMHKCRQTNRIRALVNSGGTSSEDIRGVELGVHGIRLAGIDHKEDLVIPCDEL
jgi:hypothetical protein